MLRTILLSTIILALATSGCNLSISLNDSESPPQQSPPVAPIPQYTSQETTTFGVVATQGWQNTYVLVKEGDRVMVKYVSGQWTQQVNGVALHDAADQGGYICGRSDCVEPYPDFPQGALIGRIGPQLIAIGNKASFTSQYTRYLALRMNDGDAGLYDNGGSVTVSITVEHIVPN